MKKKYKKKLFKTLKTKTNTGEPVDNYENLSNIESSYVFNSGEVVYFAENKKVDEIVEKNPNLKCRLSTESSPHKKKFYAILKLGSFNSKKEAEEMGSQLIYINRAMPKCVWAKMFENTLDRMVKENKIIYKDGHYFSTHNLITYKKSLH